MTSRLLRPVLAALITLAGCADGDAGSGERVATARFALSGDAAFFRLRIFADPPADLAKKSVFDTGCLQQQSRTYELSNIPVGDDYIVVYEGFSDAGCGDAQAISLGYRGGVSITDDGALPYYHVQIYPAGEVATLPEELNLSAAVATAIDFCDDDTDCGDGSVCYDAAKPAYWCVPSCSTDADCRGIHVRASCDIAAGWCTLRSPFPLNLSEPRAFGAATTLSDGDVLFVGGMRQDGVGKLLRTMYPLERFDAQTGLFVAAAVTGTAPPLGGDFGFAALAPGGGDRFVTVGGFLLMELRWGTQGLELTASSADLSAEVIRWDLAANTASSVTLPRGVARPAVARMAADRILIAGGLVASGSGLEATRETTVCTLGDAGPQCESGPMLEHPRQGAAATCLDEGCQRVLVIGGNPGGEVAEIVDIAAGKSTAHDVEGFGDKVFAPVLCGLDLVSGSLELGRSVPFSPLTLTVGDGAITATRLGEAEPITRYHAAVSGADSGFGGATSECWLAGGLDGSAAPQRAGTTVARSAGGGLQTLEATLGRARFGAAAARIGGGLLAGRVMFAGGVALDGTGPVKVVRGAEVLSP